MRVLVDASAAFDQGAGIGRYARNVLSHAVPYSPDTRWTLARFPERFGSPRFAFDQSCPWFNVEVTRRTAPLTRRRADQLLFRFGLPHDLRWLGGPADVVYSPDFTVPAAGPTPRVVTIHDLAFLTHPESAPLPLRRYLTRVVPEQARRADAIAVVSKATRDDVLSLLDVESRRVHVVANGVDERFFVASPLSAEQRQRLSIPEQYLLMVGTLEPRKNHVNVLRALQHVPESMRLPLIVAGGRGWAFEPVLEAAAPLVAQGRVVLLDYVPDALLPSLYAGASAVLYPSWTEGFGLPVLEGLAAGVPIVASTAPALREVGGDEVTLVEPGSPDAIADGIMRALDASDRRHRQRRQAQARRYSWPRAGAQLAVLLRNVGAGNGP